MSTMIRSPRLIVRSFTLLAHAYRILGWRRGCPSLITVQTRRTDERACQSMKCPACQKRGMVFEPFRKEMKYKVIARCEACGAAEEI